MEYPKWLQGNSKIQIARQMAWEYGINKGKIETAKAIFKRVRIIVENCSEKGQIETVKGYYIIPVRLLQELKDEEKKWAGD